ncbi:major facilitator superfamily domain-containing protein [Dactylonectria macrodidyma]|uniref:Major facilitator superfamily domain-containing protein n=1 Tax=Dactylonectria macrodidyma TaxID=307937 RepID=A0A9P9E353_9HYPO|nr:major facilitator superfamily domain-containing protein [Dactylonectria macrodidyma]
MSINTPAAGQSAPVDNPEAIAYDNADPLYNHSTGAVDLPPGWKYRRYNLFGRLLPWYASPKIQLGMVAFVCFMCPGMFNALGGMGGGGKADATLADNMNTALYSAFAVFGFFGGTFVNRLGVKLTLAFGGIGYGLYAISLLVSVHRKVDGFNIFAGVWLGICAAMLWTAQGTIMISYPHEDQKGHYFAWFWGIFNMGAVIGSLIPLGENIDVKANVTVSDGTYIGFIVLMFFGAALALTLCNANDIVRKDGSRVILMKNPTWQSELIGLYETLKFEPFILLLFPMFFSSNWFYVYQQNAVNSAYFDTRTKALNSLLYWLAQIIAAGIWGYLLDIETVRRTVRAKIALVVLFVLTFVIWGGGYAFEKTYTRESVSPDNGYVPFDWTHSGYAGPMFLYIFYGFYDAAWQATVYWFMGALSNSGRRSANYVGFYKGIQSAGAAVVNNLDARKLSFRAEFISNWALLSTSLVVAAPVIFLKIRDHVDAEDDLKGTDETLANVQPQTAPEKPVHV